MKKFGLILTLFALLGSLNGRGAGKSALPLNWDTTTHYLVFERTADGVIAPFSHQLVELETPLESLSSLGVNRALTEPQRNHRLFLAILRSESGETLYQNIVKVPTWLRGEFHGEKAGAPIDGHLYSLMNGYFVVRVPAIPGTRLSLWDVLERRTVDEFVLVDIPLTENHRETTLTWSQPLLESGPSSNRVDVLIMGDGYTAAESAKFVSDASDLQSNFFGISPLFDYQNYFNVTILFTESPESGADHPNFDMNCDQYDQTCCADPAMQSDLLMNSYVNTAFDAHFCSMNIHRLLDVDPGKVFTAAGVEPDWDTIMVLVNDPTYGGSGGTVAVVSTHPDNYQIAQHEFGHSFANLADEYDSSYPGYAACSDISGSASCEDNVTDETNPNLIKWAPWIDLTTTPIPTPENSTYENHVGLFEGARYLATNMYRSGYQCLMQYLGYPFCQVPSQSIVLKLYNGGFGNPIGGINMIEPGLTNPPSANVAMGINESKVFSAQILSPVSGQPPIIRWFFNGVEVASGGNAYSFQATPGYLGSNTLRLEVLDPTMYVHPMMAEGSTTFEYTWTVTVSQSTTMGKPVYIPLILH